MHSDAKKGKNKGRNGKAAVGKQGKAAASEDGGDEDEEAEPPRGRKAANRKKAVQRDASEDDSEYDIPPKRCAGNRKRGKPAASKNKRSKKKSSRYGGLGTSKTASV